MRTLVNFSHIQWAISGEKPKGPTVKVRLPTEVLTIVDTLMGDNVHQFIADNGKDILSKAFGGWDVDSYIFDVLELLTTPADIKRKILQQDRMFTHSDAWQTYVVSATAENIMRITSVTDVKRVVKKLIEKKKLELDDTLPSQDIPWEG